MTMHVALRTTIMTQAREYVQALGKVVECGVSNFRTAILKEPTVETCVRRQCRMMDQGRQPCDLSNVAAQKSRCNGA